jgi:hypothetical protein
LNAIETLATPHKHENPNKIQQQLHEEIVKLSTNSKSNKPHFNKQEKKKERKEQTQSLGLAVTTSMCMPTKDKIFPGSVPGYSTIRLPLLGKQET